MTQTTVTLDADQYAGLMLGMALLGLLLAIVAVNGWRR